MTAGEPAWDYVVVGSGAGGATVAARLAEAGHRVLVLEAGGDPRAAGATADGPRSCADDYDVPAFHAFASENPDVSWPYFVEHYGEGQAPGPDWKRGADGVLYPRSGALGGCTAHNALIFMRAHDSDWDAIADLTGDASWRAAAMERYWRKVEACRHRPVWRLLAGLGLNPTGHGWRGWLPIERGLPVQALADYELLATLLGSTFVDWMRARSRLGSLRRLLKGRADPNDRRFLGQEGVFYTPLSSHRHRRRGGRERLLDAARRFPGRLRIETGALACSVLLDANRKATGVEYLKGGDLYGASPRRSAGGERCRAEAAREVILSAGAFNTPQLLMLSGIGPEGPLSALGIESRVDLPGVGKNLQDRYEISVVNRMADPWQALAGAKFASGDALYGRWLGGRGMYVSNGAALATIHRSDPSLADPDIFSMAMLAHFEGYYPGYSQEIGAHPDHLSWAILKGHTRNRSGEVTLRSTDPTATPAVNFNFFDAADDPEGLDLAALVAAIRRVRDMTAPLLEQGVIAEELRPGPAVQSDAELAAYVRNEAWGHHACGTAAIGAVLDGDLRVRGTTGLRVVDASIFPAIPGFFIAAPIYVAAEKAAEVICKAAR